jgi:hypothetical protein
MQSHLSVLASVLLAGIATCGAAERDTAWAANDISVVQTAPAQAGVADTRLEVGSNGDARLTLDLTDGEQHTKGTILLVGGRWMLTQGFSPTPGAEIDAMDIAALNSQLVLKLLRTAMPEGAPKPGLAKAISFQEETNPIDVNTTSASAHYDPPWTVDGKVSASAPGTTDYDLRFTFIGENETITTHLKGSVRNSIPALSLSDSTRLAGWSVHKVGPYQEQSSEGTKLDYGAQPSTPSASTIGELRKLK